MAASDCATGLGLSANNPGSFANLENDLTEAEAAATAAWDIAQIGAALLLADVPAIPLLPLISLGFAIYEIAGLFSGRPKNQDTDNVIGAYNDSAYWPLHALAADLAEMLKNGAPISDSRSQIQAQFSQLKQGTIESIQGYAGWPPGASSPGYWQLQRFIDASWALSGQGQPAVLNAVKAMDRFTEILACLKQQQQSAGGGGSGGGGGGGGTTQPPTPASLCQSGNPDTDEIVDSCIATQTSLQQILAAIQALGSTKPGGEVDACCTAVVNAIASVAAALGNITALLSAPASPATPIDLSGIVAALGELVTAVAGFPPLLEAITTAIANGLGAIAISLGPDLGGAIQNIANAINSGNTADLIPAGMVDAMVANGSMPAPIAQFFSDRPASWSFSGLLSGIGHFLVGQLNPELGDQVIANINAINAGASPPYQPFHSLLDVLLGTILIIGIWWGKIAVNIAADLMPVAQSVLANIGKAIGDVIPGGLGAVPPGVGAPAVAALNFVKGAPAAGELITTANYSTIVQDAMGRAGLMGMTAWAAAMVGGFLLGPWEKYWGEVAAMIATAAGFEEITERALAPFLDAIIRNRAIQDANQKWPTRVPPGPQGLALFARRKIGPAQADQLQDFAGLDPTWRPAMYLGAYRPVTPFVLASAFVDQPLDRNVILDILQDNAYSDSHANTMADAIVYKSIANVRNAYLSQLITGYGKGVVGDAELQQALTDFNFSPQAQQYVMSHVLILRREVLAAETEKQIVPQIVAGLITPAAAQQQLEIAGVQPWYAELITGLAAVRAEIAVTKKELKAEEKLQAKQQLALQRTALADFANGSINAEALAAALIAAGLDPVVAASVVAEKSATQLGRLKLVYGQLLTPAEAKLQTERVDAVKNQLKEQLITYQQALAQLKGFGVTSADANAIVAGVAAAIAAASTVGTLLNPLTGLPG